MAETSEAIIDVMRPEDIPAGLALCRAAGWNQTARDWTRFLHATPNGSRVARIDGRVVGSAATIRYGDAFGWIGMVLVDPAVRGRGLGTRLFAEALRLLDDIAAARLDATPAGYPLYVKQGFAEEYRIHRMEAAAPVVTGPLSTPSVRAMSAADIPRLAGVDLRSFGAPREAMLRWMFEGAPDLAWVVEDRERVRGFSLGRRGHDFDHIGPVVADDVEAASAVATAALRATTRRVILDATPHVPRWHAWLLSAGFVEQRELIRMTTGAPLRAALERQFAILGPEFG